MKYDFTILHLLSRTILVYDGFTKTSLRIHELPTLALKKKFTFTGKLKISNTAVRIPCSIKFNLSKIFSNAFIIQSTFYRADTIRPIQNLTQLRKFISPVILPTSAQTLVGLLSFLLVHIMNFR